MVRPLLPVNTHVQVEAISMRAHTSGRQKRKHRNAPRAFRRGIVKIITREFADRGFDLGIGFLGKPEHFNTELNVLIPFAIMLFLGSGRVRSPPSHPEI